MLDKRDREMQDYLHRENIDRFNIQLRAAGKANDEARCNHLRKLIADEVSSYLAVKEQRRDDRKG